MEFRLLGPFEARADGHVVAMGRRQERLLLGVLLLHADRVVAADRLVDLIWDGDAPKSARSTIHTYVARLRTALADHDLAIPARHGGYLVEGEFGLDTSRFTDLARRAADTADAEQRAALCGDALALWRGPLFQDIGTDHLRGRVGGDLDALWLETIALHAEANLALGRPKAVVADLGPIIAAHPTRERLVASLMTAYRDSARLTDALALYRSTYRAMSEELGVPPSEALRDLHMRLLSAGHGAGVAAPPGPARDGLPHQARISTLPPAAAGFTGRDRELRLMDELMLDPPGGNGAPRTLVVTSVMGMPGVGKTALAVGWAHRVAAHFPDGQLYINLRGYDPRTPMTPLAALRSLLAAIGVPAERAPTDLDDASAMWRTLLADRRTLILLDNGRTADQIRPLLPGGANVVITTSRDSLRGLIAVDHANALPLDVLSPREAVDLLATVLGHERVAAEPEAARTLVIRCGLLPLAIRIAAALLLGPPAMAINDLGEALAERDRLDRLAVADDPQAAVRAVFAHSYASLQPREQRMFRLLAVAPGADFGPHAAAAMLDIGPAEATAALEALADAHVMTRMGEGRYGFHDLMREFGADCGTQDEPAAAREEAASRFLNFHLRMASAANEILGPPNTGFAPVFALGSPALPFEAHLPEVVGYLDSESANLAGLVRFAADIGVPDFGWQFAYLLSGYFDRGRDVEVAVEVGRAGLACAEQAGDRVAERRVLISLGVFCNNARRSEEALGYLTRARDLARADGLVRSEASATNNIGRSYVQMGRHDQGAEAYATALDLFRSHDPHDPGVVSTLINLGSALMRRGDYDGAQRLLEEALRHNVSETTDTGGKLLYNFGELLSEQGRDAEALEYLERAAERSAQTGNRYMQCQASVGLARTHRRLGDRTAAIAVIEACLDHAVSSGNIDLRATMLMELATNYAQIGDGAIASAYLDIAESLRRLVPDPVENAAIQHLRRQLGQRSRR